MVCKIFPRSPSTIPTNIMSYDLRDFPRTLYRNSDIEGGWVGEWINMTDLPPELGIGRHYLCVTNRYGMAALDQATMSQL